MASAATSIQSDNKFMRMIQRAIGALNLGNGDHRVVIAMKEGAREGVIVGVSVVAGTYIAAAVTTRTVTAFILGYTTTTASNAVFRGDTVPTLAIHGAAAAIGGFSSIPPGLLGSVSALVQLIKAEHHYERTYVETTTNEVISNGVVGAVANVVPRILASEATPAMTAAFTPVPIGTMSALLAPLYVNSILQGINKFCSRFPAKNNFVRTTVITTAAVAGGGLAGPIAAVASAIFTGGLFGYFSHKSKS